jgi:hypothetical protein
MEFQPVDKVWDRRSFLKGLGGGALSTVGLASPTPLLRRSLAAGATAPLLHRQAGASPGWA